MSISPFGSYDISAEMFSAFWDALKRDSEALRREEFTKCQDGYLGGSALADETYVQAAFREGADAWLARREKLTTINICRRTVTTINDSVYGGPVSRHVRLRKSRKGTASLPREDRILQEIMADSDYAEFVKISGGRNAAINGTSIIGPYFDAELGIYRYRTRNIEDVYPFPTANDGERLEMLAFETAMTDDEGRPYRRLEAWTPYRVGVFRSDGQWGGGFYADEVATVEMGGTNPMDNPYGIIPWQRFRAEPDVDEGMWFGLSDIRDIVEANIRINELLSIADKNAHDQGWSQLVLMNFPDDVDKVNVGSAKAIRVGEGGDAKYIYPDLKMAELLMLVDKLCKYALEMGGIPMAAIRTSSEPKSGVSLELELKPLADIASDRRRRFTRCEGELMKMTLLMHEVHANNRTFTPATAQAYKDQFEAVVEWADNLMPHDLTKEIDRDLKLMEAGLADPYVLIEKYNELGGKSAEQYSQEILK
ncbi:MAG TPA: phage portal protein, partial [Phycisphaerae bacterium]|nr:phage portal protein [Phycisphaerae bacterium]